MLIAKWDRSEDVGVKEPDTVRWEDCTPATLALYRLHSLDTHTLIECGNGSTEMHIFPDIVATVSFDAALGAWKVYGRGVIPRTLVITDPNASDDEIDAELAFEPMVYKATILR